MAVIAYPYTLVDGNVLNPAGHSQDLYSTTPGQSCYGEHNGRLQYANLAVGFTTQQPHVAPGEAHRISHGEGHRTLRYWEDSFGADATEDDSKYIAIPGWGTRFYSPYATTAIIQTGGFVSPWRILAGDPLKAPTDAPDIKLQLFSNNSGLSNTVQKVTESARYDITIVPHEILDREHMLGQWMTWTYLVSLAPGWHQFDMRLWMAPQASVVTVQFYDTAPPSGGDARMHHRLTVGHRAINVVQLV